jgi:phosphoserine phosphatase
MIIFCDIDGTLTDDPENKWGNPHMDRIQKVRDLISDGKVVVVWSGNGTEYAEAFCAKYEIDARFAIGKPDVYIDDKPKVRAEGKLTHLWPKEMIAHNYG